jgi:hypothetical protein
MGTLGNRADQGVLQVPYVGMRSFCAIMGSVTVPVVYTIMRESGYPVGIALFSAFLVLFGRSLELRLMLTSQTTGTSRRPDLSSSTQPSSSSCPSPSSVTSNSIDSDTASSPEHGGFGSLRRVLP